MIFHQTHPHSHPPGHRSRLEVCIVRSCRRTGQPDRAGLRKMREVTWFKKIKKNITHAKRGLQDMPNISNDHCITRVSVSIQRKTLILIHVFFPITLSVTSCCLTRHQLRARRSWQGRTDRTQTLRDIYVKLMMRKHLSDSLQKSSSEAPRGASEATRCAGCFFPWHEVASFSCCSYIHSAVNT